MRPSGSEAALVITSPVIVNCHAFFPGQTWIFHFDLFYITRKKWIFIKREKRQSGYYFSQWVTELQKSKATIQIDAPVASVHWPHGCPSVLLANVVQGVREEHSGPPTALRGQAPSLFLSTRSHLSKVWGQHLRTITREANPSWQQDGIYPEGFGSNSEPRWSSGHRNFVFLPRHTGSKKSEKI